MKETGQVVSSKGGVAIVSVPMKDACKTCGLCAETRGGREMLVEAANAIGAQEGEIVEVEIRSKRIMAAAFVVYMIPVIATIGGFILGNNLTGGEADSNFPIGLAVIFLVASFVGIWLYDLRLRKSEKTEATVIRIVPPEDEPQDREERPRLGG